MGLLQANVVNKYFPADSEMQHLCQPIINKPLNGI